MNGTDKAEELYDKLTPKNCHQMLVRIVETVAVNHTQATSTKPDIAISEILRNHIAELRNITNPNSWRKLFTSKRCKVVRLSINIKCLENALLLKILKIPGFLGFARIAGACISPSHTNVCCDHCVTNCDHSSPSCKRCKSNLGEPTRKCDHVCTHCSKDKEECDQLSKLCCTECNICIACNKEFAMSCILSSIRKTNSTLPPPCTFYLVQHCLEVLLNSRNLICHTTLEELREFIDGTKQLLNFEMLQDEKELVLYIRLTLFMVLKYVSDVRKFPTNPISKEEIEAFRNAFDKNENAG